MPRVIEGEEFFVDDIKTVDEIVGSEIDDGSENEGDEKGDENVVGGLFCVHVSSM